jgi:hypothetical protein
MRDGVRTHERVQRPSTRTDAGPRPTSAGQGGHPQTASAAAPLLALQATVGNQAVASLIADPSRRPSGIWAGSRLVAQRKPGDTTTSKAGKGTATSGGKGAAGAQGRAGGSGTAADLRAAEAWVHYIALRGNDQAPKAQVPAVYRSWIADIQAAVKGPGPIPKGELIDDDLAFGDAKAAVKFLRKEHERLLPKAVTDAFDLADIGIERGRSNTRGDDDAFGPAGATQLDEAQILLAIASAADDEVRVASDARYTIPKNLKELGPEARKRFEAAKGEWTRQAPSTSQQITPIDEGGLVDFIKYATETINGLRERRLADLTRAYEREREALLEKADEQLRELNRTIAESRRVAYRAGDKGMLGKVQSALESVNGAIDDTKSAANLITKRVDQLNFASESFGKAGKKLIELPALPKGLTDVADKLSEANSKLKTVIEVLDLVGPSKTQLDAGLAYLKGADMALSHFGGKSANPFVKVYVESYLSPGIKNCIASLTRIADIKSGQNRAALDINEDRFVDWSVESGGLAAYQFLKALFRTKGATPVSDEAWAYFSDHAGDLSAAVGEKMPRDRRTMPSWAARNRAKLWEAHYGSTRKPAE